MKNILGIFTILLISTQLAYGQVADLAQQLEKTQNIEEKIIISNKLAEMMLSDKPKEALMYAEKALQMATSSQNQLGIAESQANIGYLQGHHFSRPDLAYEAHQTAYTIYKKLQASKGLDDEKLYVFLNDKAIPTYKTVKNAEINTRKYRKAIQKYETLNSQFALDFASLSQHTREELDMQKNMVQEKTKHEVILSSERAKLESSLSEKERQQLALIDSIYKKQAALNSAIIKVTKAKLKQEEAEKLSMKKDVEVANQRNFSRILLLGIGLGGVLMLTIAWALYAKQRTNKLLVSKNAEILQQQEEITTQRDNLANQHELLEKQKDELQIQRDKSDKLLLNILPEEVAQELKETGQATPKQYDLVTVLFTDFKGFTNIAEKISPTEVIENLNTCFLAFDGICDKYGLEKIKTIGDAYMCAGGLPIANTTNPVDVVKAGLEMQTFMAKWKAQKEAKGEPAWELRLGIHSGEAVAGVVGKNKFAYDIWGDTVNVASRMESSGEVGKVNISEVTYNLVKEHFQCTNRGAVKAKNKGELEMYFVEKAL